VSQEAQRDRGVANPLDLDVDACLRGGLTRLGQHVRRTRKDDRDARDAVLNERRGELQRRRVANELGRLLGLVRIWARHQPERVLSL
jgi:hypothetical protein